MSFSYKTDSTASGKDYVRFRIRDNIENSGPLPSDENFSNEELEMIITEEGSWQRAVAACYEALSSAWAKHPSFTADGLAISQSHIAAKYDQMASRWRRMYGGAPGSRSHARTIIKVDGYSQDVPATEVDDVTY